MTGAPHTSTTPGKRVRLVLRDGRVFDGVFVERTARYVVLSCGRFRGREIQQFIVNPRARAPTLAQGAPIPCQGREPVQPG